MNERDLLAALARAVADGRVLVDLDCKRLLHTDSPIAVQADHSRWLYGVAAAAIAVGVGFNWMSGLVALAIGVMFYAGIGRPWIHRRMHARFHVATLFDTAAFKKLWRLRGVTLTAAGGAATCASPDGDWRRFVLDHLNPSPSASAPAPTTS